MNYKFTLDQSEVQILAMGLSELPLKTSGALFTKIQRVVTEQDSARAASVAEVNRRVQMAFDAAIDARDMPTGQVAPSDVYAGD